MSDETEEEAQDINIDWEPSDRAEFVQCIKCQIIAPYGFQIAAEKLGAVLFRIQDQSGDVEILESIDEPWKVAGKASNSRPRTLKAVE